MPPLRIQTRIEFRKLAYIGFLLLSCVFGFELRAKAAQNGIAHVTAGTRLRFEVATIKPHDPNLPAGQGVKVYSGGRIQIIGVHLKTLVEMALHCPYWVISGGDGAIEKDIYDVEAIPPEELRASISNLNHTWFQIEDENLRQMMTALLVDRFQLKYHRETKTGATYRLQRGKGPLRLKPSQESQNAKHELVGRGFGSIGWAGSWNLSNSSMVQLANFASDFILHAPVRDETHLDGYFDYHSPTSVDAESSDAEFPTFISEMGLRLKKATGPIDMFVIDHVERPTEN